MRESGLVRSLRENAAQSPDRLAFTYLADGETPSDRVSFACLDRRARAIAGYLQSRDCSGARALLACPPGPDFIFALWGCLYAGLPVTPVQPGSKKRPNPSLHAIVSDIEPSFVIAPQRLWATIADIAELNDTACQWFDPSNRQPAELTDYSPIAAKPESTAIIQYTSGSTRHPRGVVLTHGNLAANCEAIRRAFDDTEDSIGVSWLPPYHDMGLIGSLLQPVFVGGHMVLMPPSAFLQRPLRWLEAITRYTATTSGGPNFAYELCIERSTPAQRKALNLESWRVAFNGAEPVRADTLRRFEECFGARGFDGTAFRPCYGLAEATLLVTCARERKRPRSPEGGRADTPVVACGTPPLDTLTRIVDPDTCAPLPDGQVGEVWVSGPGVGQGYWNDAAETRRKFRAQTAAPTDNRSYLRTGDLGFVRDGELFVTGRLDDLAVIRGRNHYLGDLEFSIARGHAAIRTGGIAAFVDPRDSGAVVVIAEIERALLRKLDGPALARGVTETLASAHGLRASVVSFVRPGSLPKTGSGKIRRHACREAYLQDRFDYIGDTAGTMARYTGERAKSDRSDLEESIRTRVARILGVSEKTLDTSSPLSAYGLDSLRAMELQAAIESESGAQPELTELLPDCSIEELARLVARTEPLEDRPRPDIRQRLALSRIGVDFPLTEMQQAYWFGRSEVFELGGLAIHGYMEVEGVDIDLPRLESVWNILIERHEMLRAVITDDNRQKVLKDVGRYEIARDDLRQLDERSARTALDETRACLSHRKADLTRWPSFEIRASLLPDGRVRLHFSVDGVFVDINSVQTLLIELTRLYENEKTAATLEPLDYRFRDFVHASRSTEENPAREKALSFWRERLSDLPPAPELPRAGGRHSVTSPRMSRLQHAVESAEWQAFRRFAAEGGFTVPALLLTIFAEVLAKWSVSPRFTLNVPTLNRPLLHPQIRNVVGCFSSFVPVSVDFSGIADFPERARHVQSRLLEALQHSHIGGTELLRLAFRDRGEITPGLVPVVFTCAPPMDRDSRSPLRAVRKTLGEIVYKASQTPQTWLDNQAWYDDESLEVSWDVLDGRFPPNMIEDMFQTYVQRLHDLARNDGRLPASPTLPAWQIRLFSETNPPPSGPEKNCLHSPFERQAIEQAGKTAVLDREGAYTYAELSRLGADLARRLARAGVASGEPVAVIVPPGRRQAVAVFGILRAGAAYVPIDPVWPSERRHRVMRDAGIRFAVVDRREEGDSIPLPESARAVSVTSSESLESETHSPLPRTDPRELAYVIYTSGSTGTPKGVMMSHAAAMNTILEINRRFDVGPYDTILSLASLSFDLSVYDIFGLLAMGGTVIRPDTADASNPVRWIESLQRDRVSILDTVPAVARLLLEAMEDAGWEPIETLRLILVSGDRVPVDLPARLRAKFPRAEIVSLGGATEAGIWSIAYLTEHLPPEAERVPYGKPLANQSVYVLQGDDSQAPVWVPGEICIGGGSLAAGYWRDDALTARHFFDHAGLDERLYRTGDIGRRLPDGNIEFLGRADDRIKLRGYRIELAEIDLTLCRHPDIQECVTIVAEDRDGEAHLVCYYTLRSDPGAGEDVAVDENAIREYASAHLPQYMVPAKFLLREGLPLSENGKIDRRALAEEAQVEFMVDTPYVAPTNDVEWALKGALDNMLKRDDIGIDHDFFSLGATSLSLVQVQSYLKEHYGYELGGVDIFQYRTIRSLARYIRDEGLVSER